MTKNAEMVKAITKSLLHKLEENSESQIITLSVERINFNSSQSLYSIKHKERIYQYETDRYGVHFKWYACEMHCHTLDDILANRFKEITKNFIDKKSDETLNFLLSGVR